MASSSKSSKSSSKIEEVKQFVRAESMSLTDDLLDVAANEDFVNFDLKQRVELGKSLMKGKSETVKGKLCHHVAEMIKSHNAELNYLDDVKRILGKIKRICDDYTNKDD